MNQILSFKIWQIFEDGTWSDPIAHQFSSGTNQRYALADGNNQVVAKFKELDGRICLLPIPGIHTVVSGREVNLPTLLPENEAVALGLDGRDFQFNTSAEASPDLDTQAPPRVPDHASTSPSLTMEHKLPEEIQTRLNREIGDALGDKLQGVEARLEAAITSTLRSTTSALRAELLNSVSDEIGARRPAKRRWLPPLLALVLAALTGGLIVHFKHLEHPGEQESENALAVSDPGTLEAHLGPPEPLLSAQSPDSADPGRFMKADAGDPLPGEALEKFPAGKASAPLPLPHSRRKKSFLPPPELEVASSFEVGRRQAAPIQRQDGAPAGHGSRVLDFTLSHPVAAVFGAGRDRGIKPDALCDQILQAVTITSLDVQIPPGAVADLAALIEPQVTDRAVPRESVATLRGLARQLEDLGKLPETFQLNLTGNTFARSELPKSLDSPQNLSEGSIPGSEDALPLHRASTIPLAAVRLPAAPVDGKVGVRFVRLPGESIAPPESIDVTWVERGYLSIAFPRNKEAGQNVVALRIKTVPFLATRGSPADAGTISVEKSHTHKRKNPVWCLAQMPSGKSAIVGEADGTLSLVELDSSENLRQFEGHTATVLAVAVSPDGSRMLSSASDHTLRFWNTDSGDLLQTLQTGDSPITAIAFSPDGRRFVVGDTSGMAILYDTDSFGEIHWLMGHESGITSAAFSPDGLEALTGSNDHTARLWDVQTGNPLLCLRGHGGGVQAVAFSPNDQAVLTASGGFLFDPDGKRRASLDNTVRLWDRRTGEELRRLVGHREWVITAAYSPDGRRIVSGSAKAPVEEDVNVPGGEGEILLWDARTGEELLRFPPQPDIVRAVAFLSGDRIVSAGWDKTVCVWQLGTGNREEP